MACTACAGSRFIDRLITRNELAAMNRLRSLSGIVRGVLRTAAAIRYAHDPRAVVASSGCRVADACEHAEHSAKPEIGGAIPPRVFRPCVLVASI